MFLVGKAIHWQAAYCQIVSYILMFFYSISMVLFRDHLPSTNIMPCECTWNCGSILCYSWICACDCSQCCSVATGHIFFKKKPYPIIQMIIITWHKDKCQRQMYNPIGWLLTNSSCTFNSYQPCSCWKGNKPVESLSGILIPDKLHPEFGQRQNLRRGYILREL